MARCTIDSIVKWHREIWHFSRPFGGKIRYFWHFSSRTGWQPWFERYGYCSWLAALDRRQTTDGRTAQHAVGGRAADSVLHYLVIREVYMLVKSTIVCHVIVVTVDF